MIRALNHWLDRCAIRSACASVRCGPPEHAQLAEAEMLLAEPDFFCDFVTAPADLTFAGEREFRFTSALRTPWPENNVVHGKLFRSGADWSARPSVVLLHGWNGELGYHLQFPWLARRLARGGLNVAMIELPYHAQRRPRAVGAITNFISHDLLRMVEGTRQAIADVRALLAWLAERGSPVTGVWGISLGAWLTGLILGCDPRARFGVLMAPVVRLDRAIAELPFCEPVRRSLEGEAVSLERLNLAPRPPQAGPGGVLILQSLHDLFAPTQTIEELWEAWGKPEIWRLRHGHISVLASVPVLERTARWLFRKTAALTPAPRTDAVAGATGDFRASRSVNP